MTKQAQTATEQTIDEANDGSTDETIETTGEQSTRDERRDERTRTRLRETESERDRLRAALLPHVRAAVEKVAAGKLAAGSSIWVLPDLDPMTLVDDAYGVDDEKVTEAVDRLLQHAPQLAQRIPSFDTGARQSPTVDKPSWHRLMER